MSRSLDDLLEKTLAIEESMLEKIQRKNIKHNFTRLDELKKELENKIPEKMIDTLNKGFNKAFQLIFTKGIGIIEKTFREDELELAFRVNDFRINQRPDKKSLRLLEKEIKKEQSFNTCVTLAEGISLGAIGIGLPDIPLFLGVLLKGIYETAIGYGFNYKEEKEQILILKMITAALCTDEEIKKLNDSVEFWIVHMNESQIIYDFEEEIQKASIALSKALLLSKFVQGFFVLGIVGGMVNPFVYHKIMKYVSLKYKKRYLIQKRLGIKNER
ncbi:EcsC family protein [Anaerotignum propionicum]|uniref:EcsC protein family protein n=1 Tax=Anaerotignum propionicum DSM 1682 TaxID=991789 RepID=A0A110A796_ANAPI|nr:EcsC family protein [Anaerotignum propionicum]AMJ41827.1 EcsC protein family protein [Anaerotignum propionicum DSM 1682]SHF05056.1 EcsC protein family protein [[Clostridium] propionicum DSM 1682] [Anaerotignum propionicum DSM 1682]